MLFTFDTFIPGAANAAFETARALAEGTGSDTPLLLYGRMGSGKTHLLHAIEERLRERKPDAAILRTTADVLIHDLILAAREHRDEAFYASFDAYDALLVDELNMLARKQASLATIVSILGKAAARGAVAVAAWTGTARSLRAITPRFAAVVEVRYPALAARLELARRTAAARGLSLSDADLRLLAREHKRSPRELQSAIARIALERSLLAPAH